MAKFEPTDEEKAAASYLEWDDSELGKFTKYVGLTLAKLAKDSEGIQRVTVASCAMMIVGACVDANAGELSLTLDGYTHKGLPEGEWEVVVRKKTADHKIDKAPLEAKQLFEIVR